MDQQPSFDAAWKRRALDADEGAVEQLVQACLAPLFRFCLYRLGQNWHLCEEVVQETILRAINDLESYVPDRCDSNIFPWLSGLARNEMRRVLKEEPRLQVAEGFWSGFDHHLRQALSEVEFAPLTEETLLREQTCELVNITMAQLPQRDREALEAKYVRQQTVREIADATNTSEKAVESLLARARKRFREVFANLVKSECAGVDHRFV